MSATPNPAQLAITDPKGVVLALNSPDLAPPSCPASLGRGATAILRDAMARFSHGENHKLRRLAIEEAIASLLKFPFEQQALDRARAFLDRAGSSSQDAGNPDRAAQVVPTETLALALGVADSDLDDIRHDTGLLATTIGRGSTASAESDQAATRLLDRFASHPGGPVANVSLLYQNHDATAAFITATIAGSQAGSPRRSALLQTIRVARSETVLNISPGQKHSPKQGGSIPIAVATGTVLSLSLQELEVEFGAGAHQCPGEAIAKDIAAGIVRALEHQ